MPDDGQRPEPLAPGLETVAPPLVSTLALRLASPDAEPSGWFTSCAERQELLAHLTTKPNRWLDASEIAGMAELVSQLPDEALSFVRRYPPGIYRFNGGKFSLSGYNVEDLGDIRAAGTSSTGVTFTDIEGRELVPVAKALH